MSRVALGCVLLVACEGVIGDPSAVFEDDPIANPGDPFGDPATPPECDGVCVGETGLVRITRQEYASAVRAAFGEDLSFNDELLPTDQTAGAFRANSYSNVSERDIVSFSEAALDIANRVDVTSACADQTPEDCGRILFERYAPVLYRRPVRADESAPYAALAAWSFPEDGLVGASSLVIETLLQSPHFLYRPERVPDGEPGRLDGLALATRLAAFLWVSVPDEALLAAAEAGELDTPDGLEAAARRMLDDPKAAAGIGRFHREWLGIGELTTDDNVRQAMVRETEAFASAVLQSDAPTLEALLTESHAPIDSTLAEHYGVGAGDWVAVPGRSGILTHASVMTAHGRENYTRAVHRGVFLRTEVLCQSFLDPPDDALDNLEDPGEGATDRERLAAATSGEQCIQCHAAINPPGFAFEHYDALGRFREVDADGRPIIASGTLEAAGDATGSFTDAVDLTNRLAGSDILAQCLTRQWFRYVLGRVESEDDRVTLYESNRALTENGGDLRALIVALVRSDAFRYRRAPSPRSEELEE